MKSEMTGTEAFGKEAELYGATDGATRLTQRVALASILIVLIFIVRTTGDGLVSAIPSLFISIAGGLVLRRAVSCQVNPVALESARYVLREERAL